VFGYLLNDCGKGIDGLWIGAMERKSASFWMERSCGKGANLSTEIIGFPHETASYPQLLGKQDSSVCLGADRRTWKKLPSGSPEGSFSLLPADKEPVS
jgi:hypothetical protein